MPKGIYKHKGHPISEKTRKNLSLQKMGVLNPMFKSKLWVGKKHTLITRIKMSCKKRKISIKE